MTIRDQITDGLSQLSVDFQKFYQVETVRLDARFDTNLLYFTVRTAGGQTLSLSERSNGLRWYLNLFIDAMAQGAVKSNQGAVKSNLVYLLDEPGISLHVNAQKELLGFFRHLTDRGNQVIYTTHSPYMLHLDREDITKIRAIDKDQKGLSHVYKTAYDARLSPQNRQDTLAPIISALGMSLQHTFGPALNKLNIVTEGPSDSLYLRTVASQLNLNLSRVAFISSCGAPNSINLCTILAGWNCRFIALFDYDKAGVESGGEKMRKQFSFTLNIDYFYINDVDQSSIDSKLYKDTPYRIEDLVGKDLLENYLEQNKLPLDFMKEKVLLAKLFCNAVEKGEFILPEDCIDRFRALFDRLLKNELQA